MGEIGLGRLRMVAGTVPNSTTRCAEDERAAVEFVARSVSVFSSLIDELIESGEDIISKLHFSNHVCSDRSHADSEAGDALFTERSVENSIGSVFLVQIHRATENTAEFNVLTEANSVRVSSHSHIERVCD